MFYDIFINLCNKKGIKPTPLLKSLKISAGGLSNWQNGCEPNAKILKDLADYFDVSVDYLLGRTGLKEKNATQITEQSEATIIYQKLSLENKQRMLDYGNLLLQSEQLEEKPKIKNTKFN